MKIYVAMISGSDYEAEASVYAVYDDLQLAKYNLFTVVKGRNNKFCNKGWIEEFTLNKHCQSTTWHNIE